MINVADTFSIRSIVLDAVIREEAIKFTRPVLIELYETLDGENWKNKWDINDENHCNWFGIKCDSQFETPVSINLTDNNLKG